MQGVEVRFVVGGDALPPKLIRQVVERACRVVEEHPNDRRIVLKDVVVPDADEAVTYDTVVRLCPGDGTCTIIGDSNPIATQIDRLWRGRNRSPFADKHQVG